MDSVHVTKTSHQLLYNIVLIVYSTYQILVELFHKVVNVPVEPYLVNNTTVNIQITYIILVACMLISTHLIYFLV
jgi:hypothetical protein